MGPLCYSQIMKGTRHIPGAVEIRVRRLVGRVLKWWYGAEFFPGWQFWAFLAVERQAFRRPRWAWLLVCWWSGAHEKPGCFAWARWERYTCLRCRRGGIRA